MENLVSKLSLPLDSEDELFVSSAVEWLEENTTIDTKTTEDLPNAAKLFIVKYVEAVKNTGGVVSESIAGMSQTFATSELHNQIWEFALALLRPWLKSQVAFVSAERKWESWG